MRDKEKEKDFNEESRLALIKLINFNTIYSGVQKFHYHLNDI